MFHAKTIPKSSSSPYNQRFHAYSHASYFNQSKSSNHTIINNHVRKQCGLRQVSLKLEALAQARGVYTILSRKEYDRFWIWILKRHNTNKSEKNVK